MIQIKQLVRSTTNYPLWKEQTRELLYQKHPKQHNQIDKYIDYISKVCDKYGRTYIPRQVMFYLWGKRNWVIKNNQHFWIAIIGKRGGEGKSTLADYLCAILDETYTKDRSQQDYKKWLKIIKKAKKETQYPAVVLDEPDTETHELSKEGRERKNILERIRVLKMFVCICANSLSSIPSSMYERIGAVISINQKHKWCLWDSSRDKPKETIVEDLRGKDGWGKHRHAVFKQPEFVKRAYFKNMRFTPTKHSPFISKAYETRKEEDVLGLIDKHIFKSEEKNRIKDTKPRLMQEIIKIKKRYPKLTDGQIGIRLGVSRETVNKYKNQAVNYETPQL